MFFVTYHGGKPTTHKPQATKFNNIHAYDQNGHLLSREVLLPKNETDLGELRGFYLFRDYLYVVNGSKAVDTILCFQGSGIQYQEVGVFVDNEMVNSINHPFALTFDGNGHCFVSNQDDDVVTQLTLNKRATKAKAVTGVAASYLRHFDKSGTFLDGTFVASAYGHLPNVAATTPVPISAGGLDVAIVKGKVQNSVRDIVWAGPGSPPNPALLYVADEPGNLIRLYDPVSGAPCGISTQVLMPTHLLVHGNTLYVSAGQKILKAPLCSTPGHSATDICLQLTPVEYQMLPVPQNDKRAHPCLPEKLAFSGMTFDADGNFYIAVRTCDQIWKFAGADFTQAQVWKSCPAGSAPEFISYMGPDPQA